MEIKNLQNLKNIPQNIKKKLVQKVFSDVSTSYDLMNDIMSFGFHRLWKNIIFDFIPKNEKGNFMDLAGGSGDITKLIKKNFPLNDCVLVDNNKEMIVQAKKKLQNYNIDYVLASSEKLPFNKESFDNVITSFGLRNFYNMELSLIEIERCLKKSVRFFCLEFSEINSKSLRFIFNKYYDIIPNLGKLFAKNEFAYKYLIDSIRAFPNQIELTQKFIKTGFKNVECYDLFDGLASIHIGKKIK